VTLEERQELAPAPLGRALTRRIAVERDDDLFDLEILQTQVLLGGKRGAHRRDNVRDARLMRCEDVEVALDDHGGSLRANGRQRRVERVERRALVEERG